MGADFLRKWWPVLLLTGFIFIGGGVAYTMTRGIRNKNPGNIRVSNSKWQGQVGKDDAGFVIFATPADGIRALAKTLKTYQNKYGLRTIEDIIYRWAPPNENDTESYIKSVEKQTRIPRNLRLDLFSNVGQLAAITNAIIKHENGMNPYSDNEILTAVQMA